MSPRADMIDALRIERSAPRRRVLPVVLVVLFVAIAAAAGGYWWWRNRDAPIAVRTVAVRAESGGGRDRTLLNASGYVTARRDATVSSKVTGKVVEVLVEEGMRVEEGQVLARLDASNVETSLQLAEAQLVAARRALGETEANLEQAQRELDRLRQARERGAATQLELDRAETATRSLEARLDRQRAEVTVNERELAIWQQQLEDTVIRAPFAGVVTTKNAQPGEMISPMSVGGFTRTGICTIVDMDSLEIEVDVNESYINRVAPGQPVEATLDSYPDWRIPASVIAIVPTADRQKATVKVRVGFKELDPRILPDMSVKVAFRSAEEPETGQAPTILLPAAAVSSRDGRDVVWVLRDGKVERRAVTIGERRNDQATILAGLNGGERVVVDAPPTLTDGASVKEARP
ncbi:MAG: efflux RND transporter periplasmic adaptor subunit [Phycisphaerales bacterium]|nr:efflux RND transporter periplasmic adaptor subunit [Phycisphaerales bacterium]